MAHNNIPTEILLHIVNNLSPNEKRQGLLICRDWYPVFRYSLYHSIHIQSFCQLKLLFQTLPTNGHLVRRFLVHKIAGVCLPKLIQKKVIIPRLLFDQLPDLCPNMESLDFDPETWKFICFHMNVRKWTKMREIPTLSTVGSSLPFLQSLGKGLTSLSIQSEMILDISTQNKLASILSLVPHITEFTIQGNTGSNNIPPATLVLSIEDIELIHKVLPNLESFTITGNNIQMPIGEVFNIDNFPTAHQIRKLHWNTQLMPSAWLLYVTHKYLCVQDLVLAVQNHLPNVSFLQFVEEEISLYTQVIQKCRHLQKIHLSSPLLNDWFNTSFFESLIKSPCIQEVGPIVQKENRIRFDTELSLAALPGNRRLITALEIEQWRLNMKLPCALTILKSFTKLAYLDLKCDSYNSEYDLENLLESCPHLETLILEWGALTLKNTTAKRHPLKSICITYVAFEPAVFYYLSNKCRSLSTLQITKCKQLCEIQDASTQTVIKMDMPHNKFDLISMDGIRLDYSNANMFCRCLSSYARVVSIVESGNPVKWYQHIGYNASNRKVPIVQAINDMDVKIAQDYFSNREQHSYVNGDLEEEKTNFEFGYIRIKCQSLRHFILDGNFSC